MDLKFDIFLSELKDYKIKVYRNTQSNLSYKEVRFLYDREMKLEDNILYLGKTTMLPIKMDTFKNIGLILINDCDFFPSQIHGDIALFPCNTDMFKLFNDVLNIFYSKQKLLDSSASLLNSLIKGKGLNYIVQVGSEILGNPVFLVDASSKLLASSAITDIDDMFWKDLASFGYGNDENLEPYVHEGFVDKIHQNTLPILIEPRFPHNLKRIVGKIELNDKTIGYIGVLENNQKFKEEDITITGLLCDVVASEMQKSKLYDNLTGVKHEFLLIDLLDGRIRNETVVKERSKALFPSDDKNLFVVAVNLPKKNINAHFLGYLRWSFESTLPYCKSVYYNEYVILVINTKNQKQWQGIKTKLIDILKKNNLNAGLSLMFHDITNIMKYYMQAESASKLGRLLKIENFLFDYDNLYIYDILTNLKEGMKVNDFCHPSILKIQNYDSSCGTDYYNTLYKYLVCGGNMTLTANQLFVHRNTIVHRINKIQEITGLDLSDGNNRFKLLLSYRIMELHI
ncbi:PucR family transcriptional regulator [Sporosalibacterium faouarense]|uniref:PucR family transcriptional regulator n=1 Tax=Sporosalibacterium faouarense TaxID=516123 RepID=UPI00192BCDFB|nr:PucR family transcriptional regulator [Sporosalibacterium faouarense]